MLQPRLRAVGYIRVSSQEQTEGHSLDAQTDHIEKFVDAQGWKLVQMYRDAGISAKKGSRRPAFDQMLKDAKDGQFDVIIVDKIDRFFRHLGGLLTTLDQLSTSDVALASVQEKLDFTSPWGKLMLTVLGMLAEIYIDNLRQETKKGNYQRTRKGLWHGVIPFGYCNGLCAQCTDPNGEDYCPNYGQPNQTDGKHLIAHPVESIAVRMTFDYYETNKYSTFTITKMLNTQTVKLPDGREVRLRQKGHRRGNFKGPFTKDAVRSMLVRLAYTGKLAYIGTDNKGDYYPRRKPREVFDGQQPAIITTEQFERVQELRILNRNSPIQKASRPTKVYILTGILRCAQCGGTMRGVSSNGKYFWYRDAQTVDGILECPQKQTKAGPVDNQVYDFLCQVIQNANKEKIIEMGNAQYQTYVDRFEKAQEMYLRGELSRDKFQREKEFFEKQETILRDKKLYATMALHETLETELGRWDELLPLNKKRLLRLVLEAAWLRGNALVAVQPTIAFLPILNALSNCGQSGNRTPVGLLRTCFQDKRHRPLGQPSRCLVFQSNGIIPAISMELQEKIKGLFAGEAHKQPFYYCGFSFVIQRAFRLACWPRNKFN